MNDELSNKLLWCLGRIADRASDELRRTGPLSNSNMSQIKADAIAMLDEVRRMLGESSLAESVAALEAKLAVTERLRWRCMEWFATHDTDSAIPVWIDEICNDLSHIADRALLAKLEAADKLAEAAAKYRCLVRSEASLNLIFQAGGDLDTALAEMLADFAP